MATTIQIRDVPEDVHAALSAKAAAEGLSLSQFMLRAARTVAERPAVAEVLKRAARRDLGVPRGAAVKALREIRDAADE